MQEINQQIILFQLVRSHAEVMSVFHVFEINLILDAI